MDLNKWAAEIHEIARAKGWWDEPRTSDDIIALCHSELSEALECYRDGNGVAFVWLEKDGVVSTVCLGTPPDLDGWKPEGVPIELADCVIRVMDYAAHEGWVLLDDALAGDFALTSLICRSHSLLSKVLRFRAQGYFASLCIAEIAHYLDSIGHDLETLVKLKCDYNRTRPHRHGGKVI